MNTLSNSSRWFVIIPALVWMWQCPGYAAQPAGIASVRVEASPLVARSTAGERGGLILRIKSEGLTNANIVLQAPGWAEPVKRAVPSLAKGDQRLTVECPPLTAPVEVTVKIDTAGEERSFGPFKVEPPRRWTIYLTQHTHTDIGYTRPQTEILPEHLRYIDFALDYCDLTDSYPEDAKFRWTCETSWAVREYLKGRPGRQVERLKKRVREGRIEVCGLLLNMSEIAPEQALVALLRPLRALRDNYGINVQTAMQNDVNGAGWCLPDYFSDIGIRYLSMGINQTRSILPFDKPTTFWWESPSGKRVLAYRSDHYMTANFWGLEKGVMEKVQPAVEDYLLSLQNRKYPFDRVGVQFSGYFTDNSPPSTIACDVVRKWNEQYAWPKLRLSTSREFLAYVEKEHGSSLPVHRQAWPDWWTDGFGSAARETAAARETETSLQVTHGIFAMAALLGAQLRPETLQRAARVQDDLLFYHEHTYGAAESISDPLAENSQVQWGEKASYVWSAVLDSNLLREEAFGQVQEFIPRADVPVLGVFNTLNWARSGLVRVFIDHEILNPDYRFEILDGADPVLAQVMERRSEGTYLALWVKEVPPMGCKLLRIKTSKDKAEKPAQAAAGNLLENSFYKLVLDPAKGGLSSVVDKGTGEELVDNQADFSFGQCLYETMPANREMKPGVFKRTSLRNIKVKPGATGPIWKSLLVTADMDGCASNNGVRAEFRLYEPEKRVELHYAMRKLPVPTPEAVYVALPFRAPESHMVYEAQGGLVTPGEDQIPGSSSDWQTLQSFISLRMPGGQIVAGSEQAPLVQLGDFNLGKFMRVTKVAKPHVYSWIMNNYWFTNFRTEQEGEFKWHYYLTSNAETNATFATRFGWGSRVPLATRVFPPAKAPTTETRSSFSAFSIDLPNVLVVEARPAAGERGVVLHLRELEGKATTITGENLSGSAEILRADEVDALEQTLRESINSLSLSPFEVKFVRLQFR